MLQFIARLFGGNKSRRDIAQITPLVEKIKLAYSALEHLSNDELRAKTAQFKETIANALSDNTQKRTEIKAQIDALDDTQIGEKDTLYHTLEDLRKERNVALEEVLLQILPEAFAVVKETARRFCGDAPLIAKATDLDRTLAETHKHIRIVGENCEYATTWQVSGSDIKWNMVHYDVQLIGGVVLHQGKIAEMATGEGKTLVSTLPAYLNALAGEGVHIVTVNDYLARRDAQWNAPIFEWLGLRVDCIDTYPAHSQDRKEAYLADITYGTNNEFGFDYLRDNMVSEASERVQRVHAHYAMIDEVDSVLIDDARTPLIISGPIGKDESREKFLVMRPVIEKLVEAQKKLLADTLAKAKKEIAAGRDSAREGGLDLYRVYRGLPKNHSLIKFLSEPGIKAKMHKVENHFLADNQKEMRTVDKELYFYIDEKNNLVGLTDKGHNFLTGQIADKDFFVLPDLSVALNDVDTSSELSEFEKQDKKELILQDYNEKSDRIHTLQQLLKAYTLFEKDVEYVVIDSQVKIVDEQTGRVMEGRRYSDGLHQALEAKENVNIEAASQTYATITLQNYFRMYHKLAGMTGTAETEATEFWQIYKLDVVSIPTNVAVVRKDTQDLVFKTKREKYGAIIAEIEKLIKAERPVLVGTTSVEVSELLSRMLKQKGIAHNVLNAKQHKKEAQIIAEAGLAGKVTIATNMAGRGTDIKLAEAVKNFGGLSIVGTERHESRRVDRQLRGRAGRQGDPGTSQFFVSLEDNLMRMFGSERIASLMDKMGYKEGEVIQHGMVTRSIERAQKKVEENNFGIRKRLLEYDDVMNKQRGIIYKKRANALFGDQLSLDIDNAFYDVASTIIQDYYTHKNITQMESSCLAQLHITNPIAHDILNADEQAKNNIQTLYEHAIKNYQAHKEALVGNILPILTRVQKDFKFSHINLPIEDGKKRIGIYLDVAEVLEKGASYLGSMIEKSVSLNLIDEGWKDHLKLMDDLRQGVQNAVYEQKDPLVIYKGEAFELFRQLDGELNRKIVAFLTHARLPEADAPIQTSAPRRVQNVVESHAGSEEVESAPAEVIKQQPVVVENKIGRNDPCPCGSGKKYKQCHGREAAKSVL